MIDNVCKFSINRSSDLICEHFVLETRASQSNTARARANFICLVLDGEGILNIDGRQNEINRGTLFFINSGKDFSINDRHGLKYYYVCFRGRRADELIERFKINEANYIFEECESLIPFWQESQHRADEGHMGPVDHMLGDMMHPAPGIADIDGRLPVGFAIDRACGSAIAHRRIHRLAILIIDLRFGENG